MKHHSYTSDLAERFQRLSDEFYDDENILFFCSERPAWCFLCFFNGKKKVLPSFEWLIHHLDFEHDEDPELILAFEEAALHVFLEYKIAWDSLHGRWSN